MAITIAELSTPNAGQTTGTDGQFRTHTVKITFDNSYPTGGYVVTAAKAGLSYISGVIIYQEAANSAGTNELPTVAKVNAAGSQATLQLYRYDGAQGGKANLEEVANAVDVSAFSGIFKFVGY